MDGFGGYKTAASRSLPEAAAVMDPFPVVAFAGTELDLSPTRPTADLRSPRPLRGCALSHTSDPAHPATAAEHPPATPADRGVRRRRPPLGRADLERLPAHHRRLRRPDRRRGKTMMTRIIDSLRRGVPAGLEELAQLGRTLHRRRHDVLAYFDHHASNGAAEAINGRLEALRRSALGSGTSPATDPLTAALRQPRPTDQCTLIPEEPL